MLGAVPGDEDGGTLSRLSSDHTPPMPACPGQEAQAGSAGESGSSSGSVGSSRAASRVLEEAGIPSTPAGMTDAAALLSCGSLLKYKLDDAISSGTYGYVSLRALGMVLAAGLNCARGCGRVCTTLVYLCVPVSRSPSLCVWGD